MSLPVMLLLLASAPAPAAPASPASARAPASPAFPASPPASSASTPTLSETLAGLDATIVVHEVGTAREWVHDGDRADRRYLPCSTFKIPNTLIGLETGVIADATTTFRFDPARHLRRPNDSDSRWAVLSHDHDLRSAFHDSVVWYYRELAQRVGATRMQAWLDRLDYGNRDMSQGVDGFWLQGPCAISAREQVRFLERGCGLAGSSPFSERSIAILRDVMKADSGEGWTLFAKTGSGEQSDGRKLGWYVGWVERDGRTFAFAFNMSAGDWDTVFAERVPRCRAALASIGALPAPAPPG